MRRVPAPAIWSITVLVIPLVVLVALLVLRQLGVNSTTQTIASFAPTLLIGVWVVSLPIGVITVIAVRGRLRLIGIAAIALAVLEPFGLLSVWIGTG